MTDIPKISVISAWYNRPHDIEASLFSILDQEGVNFEYIVVDDASTDQKTIEQLEAASDHPRMILQRNDRNLGFTRSIIRAASYARGEYVAVHDAGDLSLPGRLLKQQTFLDQNPEFVMVGTGVEDFDVETGRRSHFTTQTKNRLRGVDGRIYSHGEVMFRANAYKAVGGYRSLFYFSQDTDLWRRLSERGQLGHLDEVLYERRIFADGVRGDKTKRVSQAVFGNLGMISAEARKAGHPDPVEKYGALSLLKQPHNRRFESYASKPIKHLLLGGMWKEAYEALSGVPAGMMTFRMLLAYTFLRIIGLGRKK